MVKRIRVAVVAAAGCATLVAGPVTAASAGATAPAVTAVSVNPSPVVVTGGETVKVAFTAETSDTATQVVGWMTPPVGARTQFNLVKTDDLGAGKARWKYTKDVDRQFAPGRWNFTAAVDSGGSGGRTEAFTVKQVYQTDFDDIAARPSAVREGERITLGGVLRQNTASGWGALAGVKVHLAFRPLGGSYTRLPVSDGTDSKGRFELTARAFKTGHWRAEYDGSATALSAKSETDRVDVRGRTLHSRIVDFDAGPDPVDEGDRLSVRGTLQVDGKHGWEGYKGQKVAILFRADGSHRWDHVSNDWTDHRGRFGVDVTAERSGHWRAEFAGNDGVEGDGSHAEHVTVRKPEPDRADSRVIKFNASPEPGRYGRYLKFRGALQVRDDWGWDGHRAKVGLYFKPKGSHKWYFVKTTWSTGSGKLSTKAKAYNSGYWKFVFKGDEDFYGDSSRSDYVRVRR
ncbi:hypothetical protein [Planomonospora venezuelensis]|uniref:Uncharacterized protein n=1 Tax=Planomonospora venezuelensis TaxID=1999 RepID=A0A841D8K4_PLAVE|nr:hypothetical protein [Planomonospora venezuelensis]MBB5964917.1 hypothetical protein [Planomonospora venezuelensis]GIM99505.1 hypothetical protein Pve01_11640 [Planomonospora venezuelensis]